MNRDTTIAIVLPFAAILLAHAPANAAVPSYDPQSPSYPAGLKSCGIPNEPTPPTSRCIPCEKSCPDSGADGGNSSGGGSASEESPLGPSPHASSTPPEGEIETPRSVIANNHGGALLDTTDLSVPGSLSGVPLSFTRYYNSRDAEGLGDLMGHGRTWTHTYSWRMTAPGSSRRIFFPSGRKLDFTPAGTSTYLGQASTLYTPPAGNGERLHRVGDFWHLIIPGGRTHTFERVVRSDGAVLYHPRESIDTRGNRLDYTTNAAARITRAADPLGNAIDLTYSQVTLNRRAAVELHTVASPPQVGWNEILIPAGQSFRWIQAVSAPGAYFEISEVKFYKDNGSGGYTLLSGTAYGTGPAINDGTNTFDNAFDGSGSTRFTFCRPNNGIAGLDLGPSGAAQVTRIRYYVMGMFSGDLGRFEGMRFEGMLEQPETHTVLSAVSATTGDSVEFDYGTHFDTSIGQSHSVLEKVTYRNAANAITDEATFEWTTAQEGAAPSLRRSQEPRNTSETPDIAFDYYPGHLAVKGQPAYVLAGDPAAARIIQVSDPRATTTYTAPDGGEHEIVNTNGSAYRPTSTTDAGGKTTTYAWNASGFLTSRSTSAGATGYTRNSLGQALTMTTPDGLTRTHTYDTLGRLLTITESANGYPSRITTHTRNTSGRVTRTTFPDGSYEDYTYDTLGLLTAVRERNGSFTVHTYDTTVGSPTAGLRLTTTRGLPSATATSGGETTAYAWHLPGNPSGSPVRTLASVTDPRGRITAYEYDHAGRVVKTTYSDGSIRQLLRDDYGNTIAEFDGSLTEYWDYDTFRRVTSHEDRIGGITTYDYGLNGSACGCYGSGGPTLVTSPAGRKTRRIYDLMGRLLSETRGFGTADASTSARQYDVLGRLTKETDPDGFTVIHTHDAMGRTLTSTQAPFGFAYTTSRTYSPFGDTLTVTRPGARLTETEYDTMGRPVTITDPLSLVTVLTYDSAGNRATLTEAFATASARTTTFGYDVYNRPTTTTFPDTTQATQTYHPGGEPHISTDESNRQIARDTVLTTWTDSIGQSWTSFATHTTRDPAGLAHTTVSLGPPMSFTGGTRKTVSPEGRISEAYMDALGRTVLSRSGLVTATSLLTADVADTVMTYDGDGFMLTSTSDPGGLDLTTTYTPDGLARIKTVKDPLNRTTTYTYDRRSNRKSTTLPDGRKHTAIYDTLGRLTATTDPKNQKLTYTYWYETGSTLTLKDAKNQTTAWTYNLRGQILTKAYPNGDDHAYTYDTLGRVKTHTTPKNEVCTYSYDLRDRQTLADWNTTTPDTTRTYWPNGLLKSIDNGISRSDYAYDVKNQLTSETQTLVGHPAKIVSYTYDADGLRDGMTPPSGIALDYAWTARGQLGVLSQAGPPPLATYTYDKAGRPDLLTHENGIVEDRQYNAASELTARLHKLTGTTVSGHGYTHDTTGRRTGETFSGGVTATRTYGYDTADQLTSATYGGGLNDSYNYDAAGNRSTATVASLGGTTTTYSANNANQYTAISGMTAPVHDANGNLTSQNGNTYTWDSENRLLSVLPTAPSNGDKGLAYSYDGQHRRVTRTVLEWHSSGWHNVAMSCFVYDGWNVIEEYEANASASSNSCNLARVLTWGTDLSGSLQGAGGVGGLLMVEEINGSNTTAYHFHYDGNGNVTEVTDLNGANVARYRYDAYGNTLIATGSYAASNRYRFSTKPLEAEVSGAPLYYYGYRYYDPVTGRWPSRDPIEEEGGINLYGFVGNNGVNQWDVLGERAAEPPRMPFVSAVTTRRFKCVCDPKEGEVTEQDRASCPEEVFTAIGRATQLGPRPIDEGRFLDLILSLRGRAVLKAVSRSSEVCKGYGRCSKVEVVGMETKFYDLDGEVEP